MNADELSNGWRKSAYSGNGDCVEWMMCDGVVLVRNSNRRAEQALAFTAAEWRAFVKAVKDGQADLLE